MAATHVVTSVADVHATWPDLTDTALVALDLRSEGFDWNAAELDRCVLLGCRLPPGDAERLSDLGALVLGALPRLRFEVFRTALYSFEELADVDASDPVRTLDTRMGSWFASSPPAVVHDAVVRALHDATIDVALARFVMGKRVVGVMGGHNVVRSESVYRAAAHLGRELARAGFMVATGGGPGVMEAANLGAWFAPFDDPELESAFTMLAAAPAYADDPDAYLARALEVRQRWPRCGTSLGVPTWVYMQEPTTGFATSIAKYFTNSLREDGLLAIARSGVVYAPGAAGTEQEIFTDSAQNSLNLERVRSPMVFFGVEFFEREHHELVAAVHRQATTFGWDDLVLVSDDPAEIVEFIDAHDPDREGRAGPDRRRSHHAHRGHRA